MKTRFIITFTLVCFCVMFMGRNSSTVRRIFNLPEKRIILYEYENLICEKVSSRSPVPRYWCDPSFLHTHSFVGPLGVRTIDSVSRYDNTLYAYFQETDMRYWNVVLVKNGKKVGVERCTEVKGPLCESKINMEKIIQHKTDLDSFYLVFRLR